MSRNEIVGKPTLGRAALAAMAVLAALVALSFVIAGCSTAESTGETTSTVAVTTTAAASTATTVASTTGSTTAGDPEHIVVGGKTEAEYAAQIPDLQKAVDASPSDLTALQNLAVAQYGAKKYDDAAATYLAMLKIKDDPTVHNNYGNVLRDQKKTEEAKAQYRAAIAGDSSLVAPYVNLTDMLASEGSLSDALKVLDQGIAHTVGDDRLRLQDYKTSLAQGK
jgi:Tfp pilus assembly protein PilF